MNPLNVLKPPPELGLVLAECQAFPAQFRSLNLATCNVQGEPEASYAPYVEYEGSYYVYVSELSAHTANLAATHRCCVLFIESEAEAKHLFARRRLTLQCTAEVQPRDSAQFARVLDLFADKFGGFMEMMRTLADFHLYELRPQRGGYVAGFAQAYTLEGAGLRQITHRQEQSHRRSQQKSAPLLAK